MTDEKQPQTLSKTCSICGELKPLSAFLQMTGAQGTEYGSVCASCRKKGTGTAAIDKDESTESSSGVRIDSESKQKADKDKILERETVKELNEEERKLNEEEQLLDRSKLQMDKEQKRTHRETFLNRTVRPAAKTSQPGESRWKTEATAKAVGTVEHAQKLEAATKEELKEKGVEASSVDHFGFGLKEKMKGVAFTQGASFSAFAARLGKQPGKLESSTTAEKGSLKEDLKESFPSSGPGSRKR